MEALGRSRKWHEAPSKLQRQQSSKRECPRYDSVERYPRYFSEAACALLSRAWVNPTCQRCSEKFVNDGNVRVRQSVAKTQEKVNK
ncbi:hypothetical protein Taro_034651 [Colocasia esculenta]|uniref:Uncharacterized protein n=1 Tax=Colocasia esculenta TaxID=4460 RepID=A0A843VWY5_COLES|nr:hypothetical protein [Colocasia esculenta]